MPLLIAVAWIGRFFTALSRDKDERHKTPGEKLFSLGVYVFVLFPLALLIGTIMLAGATLFAWHCCMVVVGLE